MCKLQNIVLNGGVQNYTAKMYYFIFVTLFSFFENTYYEYGGDKKTSKVPIQNWTF